MTRKTPSIAPDAIATCDRAISTLQVLKTHLKAKKLNGSSLSSLLNIVQSELRELDEPFQDLRFRQIDEELTSIRRLCSEDDGQ